MQQLFVYAVPAFTLAMLAEYLWMLYSPQARAARGYHRPDTLASLGMGFGSLFVGLLSDFLLYHTVRLLNGLTPLSVPTDAWWALPLGIIAVDFAFYWFHRMHHELRFMWAGHVNHHSSTYFNLSTALRQSWTERLTAIPFYAVLGLFGLPPELILLSFGINLLYQFWVHTEAFEDLGPFGLIFNTPAHHQVHHGSDPLYLDRNYGGILIIWDRLFGSFEPKRAPAHYGLVSNIDSYNLLTIAFHEWAAIARDVRQAKNWREVVGYIAGPPGYHPQGLRKTAAELRAEALAAMAEEAGAPAEVSEG